MDRTVKIYIQASLELEIGEEMQDWSVPEIEEWADDYYRQCEVAEALNYGEWNTRVTAAVQDQD